MQSAEFYPDGKVTLCLGNKPPFSLDWTKGLVLNKGQELAEAYEIRKIGGNDYLFVEWKSGIMYLAAENPATTFLRDKMRSKFLF